MSTASQIVNPQSVSEGKAKHRLRSVMNIALWGVQVLWGVFFSFTGFGKIMCYRQDVWNHTLHQPVPWFSAVPQYLFVFIGVSEFLGGAGLILPAMTRVKPKLTPLAATGLALVMILAALFHIARSEYSFFLPLNLLLAAGAVFIAYGRVMVKPVAEASLNSSRLLVGLLVFVALLLVGFLPIWYQTIRTH